MAIKRVSNTAKSRGKAQKKDISREKTKGVFADLETLRRILPPGPSVRVEARSAGELCSIPVSGTYGYNEATGEVAFKRHFHAAGVDAAEVATST